MIIGPHTGKSILPAFQLSKLVSFKNIHKRTCVPECMQRPGRPDRSAWFNQPRCCRACMNAFMPHLARLYQTSPCMHAHHACTPESILRASVIQKKYASEPAYPHASSDQTGQPLGIISPGAGEHAWMHACHTRPDCTSSIPPCMHTTQVLPSLFFEPVINI
jgi:hypothetical protein